MTGDRLILHLRKPEELGKERRPKPTPLLILRERTKTDDYELLAEAWKAANDKARELGWM